MSTEPLNIPQVRAQFPALARQIDGRTVIYADGPGGTQVPASVSAAMAAYLALFVGATKNFLAATRSADPLVRGLAVGGIGWLATYAANSAFHNYLDSSTLLWVFAGLSVVLARNAGNAAITVRQTPN